MLFFFFKKKKQTFRKLLMARHKTKFEKKRKSHRGWLDNAVSKTGEVLWNTGSAGVTLGERLIKTTGKTLQGETKAIVGKNGISSASWMLPVGAALGAGVVYFATRR